jgi:hypothetical protein
MEEAWNGLTNDDIDRHDTASCSQARSSLTFYKVYLQCKHFVCSRARASCVTVLTLLVNSCLLQLLAQCVTARQQPRPTTASLTGQSSRLGLSAHLCTRPEL